MAGLLPLIFAICGVISYLLNPVSAVCAQVLVHGDVSDKVLGIYEPESYSIDNFVVYKHAEKNVYIFYTFFGSFGYWGIADVPDRNVYYDTTMVDQLHALMPSYGTEIHVYDYSLTDIASWIFVYALDAMVPTQLLIADCVDIDHGVYSLRYGLCSTPAPVGFEDPAPKYFRPMDCASKCRNVADCKAFTFDQSCVLHTTPCFEAATSNTAAVTYRKYGLVSTEIVGMATYQSGTDWQGDSEHAVDGDPDSVYFNWHCSHTLEDVHPWWMVHLDQPRVVLGVLITGRQECCSEDLHDVAVYAGVTSDIAATVATYQAGMLDGWLCERRAVLDTWQYIPCQDPILADFVVIYGESPAPSVLTLCEVELSTEPVSQYRYYDAVQLPLSEASSFCAWMYHGDVVSLKDGHELGMFEAQLLASLPAVRQQYEFWAANRVGTDYTENWQTRHKQLRNVASKVFDATCSASSEYDVSTSCDNALDGSLALPGWWTSGASDTNPWIRITFRYEYLVEEVRLLQPKPTGAYFQQVSLVFSTGPNQVFTLRPSGEVAVAESLWEDLILAPAERTDSLKVQVDAFSFPSLGGFLEVQVYSREDVGFVILDGSCTVGGMYNVIYTDLVTCYERCRQDATCQALTYMLEGQFVEECAYYSAPCGPGDVSIGADWSITLSLAGPGEVGYALRTGRCTMTLTYGLISGIEDLTGYEAGHAGITAFVVSVDSSDPSFRVASLGPSTCMDYSKTPTHVIFERVGELPELAANASYVGCYKDLAMQDLSGFQSYQAALTTGSCVGVCSSGGFAYSGLRMDMCSCGDTYGRYGESIDCFHECNPGEVCGADSSNSIFINSGPAPDKLCTKLDNWDILQANLVLSTSFHMEATPCDGIVHGIVCETPYDSCVSNPCWNGGTCNTFENYYNCTCAAGYVGDRCEIDINECVPDSCQNGAACVDEIAGYSCTCNQGYTGTNCETDVPECASEPCVNGGTCTEPAPAQYTCTCADGYVGTRCEINVDECASSPCRNGATCTDGVNGYSCSCRLGYTGTRCETDIEECASDPCLNGGTCTEPELGRYECQCVPGYQGTRCQLDIDECASSPCVNDATCDNLLNMYECRCVPGFTGYNCEIEIDECASDPCVTSVRCIDKIDAYECECIPGFDGVNCEIYRGNPGHLSAWGNWSECSTTCDLGIRYRERHCIPDDDDFEVGFCSGHSSMSSSCVVEPCPPVDGAWSAWQPITPCSVTCGVGVQQVERTCSAPQPTNGGANCTGDSAGLSYCQLQACSRYQDCTEWSTWTNCSGTCGTGSQTRWRDCTAYPGQNASHTSREHQRQDCQLDPCPDQELRCEVCESSFSASSTGSMTCSTPTVCDVTQPYCVTSYSAEGSRLLVSKGCLSAKECDTAMQTLDSFMCSSLVGVGSMGSYDLEGYQTNGEVSSVIESDVSLLWQNLNGTCTVCCTGDLCNSGVVPKVGLLYVQSTGPQPRGRYTTTGVLALLALCWRTLLNS